MIANQARIADFIRFKKGDSGMVIFLKYVTASTRIALEHYPSELSGSLYLDITWEDESDAYSLTCPLLQFILWGMQ